MAALNYQIKLTDTGNNGAGPYTMVAYKNGTDPVVGGGSVLVTDTASALRNVHDLLEEAFQFIGDDIAVTNSTADTFGN